MTRRLRTVTLGCKVNQYETEFVREGLLRAGYRDAADTEAAEVCVVNTCTVTSEGDSKSRQVIRRLARDNPQARIVVMGCYATRAPQEVAALPNVAEVVTDKRELPDLLGRFGVIDVPDGISQFGDRQRAYVKVQDGCMLKCSYCIIPHVRPGLTSRPPAAIVAEVQRLVEHGHREIVLTGIHLGHYGVDWNLRRPKSEWTRLADLVRLLVEEVAGDFRLRLSSIEATEVTPELIGVLAQYPERVCPHLHICLQSGADEILRRMRRRWSSRMFLDRCRELQQRLPQPALTTDVIVGFPGETEQHFQQTCELVRAVGFSKVHVFPFSARRGTPAAEFDGQVERATRSERGRRLAELAECLRHDYFQTLLGSDLTMLVEQAADDSRGPQPAEPVTWLGTACRYAPLRLTGGGPAGSARPAGSGQGETAAPGQLRLAAGQLVAVRARQVVPQAGSWAVQVELAPPP